MNNNFEKKPVIKIGTRIIGEDYPPLVIVELGINHEGSLMTAFKMVDAAYNSGAEIIKHQTHVIEDEMSGEARKVIPGNADISIYEIMESCTFNEEDEVRLKNYIESKGMIFITSSKIDSGQGHSDKIFLELLDGKKIWSIEYQKQFQDINYE